MDSSGYPEISAEELDVVDLDALEEEISAFLKAVRTSSPPPVDGHQGMRALQVALEISEQIQKRIERAWDLAVPNH